MAKLSLWKPQKGKDFNFIDRIVREQFYVGSVSVYVHKYIGLIDQRSEELNESSAASSDTWDELNIQDFTFLENRNRNYANDVIELRGHYIHADTDFELMQFNMGITDDTKYIVFHLNDMIEKLGRRLMSGDVLEMPNLKDDALLDENADAANRWFEVKDASWPSSGFSALWYPHLWRVKAKVLTDSPEYNDITKNSENPLTALLSTYNADIDIAEKNTDEASRNVPYRNFDVRHIYVVDKDLHGDQYPWIYAGDGVPPEGSRKARAGTKYPENPNNGEYFLRSDYDPPRLFKYESGVWRFVELDYAKTWTAAHRVLDSFLSNDKTFTEDGNVINEKQPLSKVLKPKSDF